MKKNREAGKGSKTRKYSKKKYDENYARIKWKR